MERNCTTCEYASSDGEYGTIPTCDASTELDETHNAHEVDAAIDAWSRCGEQGPCPHHKPAWWTDPEAMAAFEDHMRIQMEEK